MSLAFGRIYSSLRATIVVGIVVGIVVASLATTSRAEHRVALLIDNSGYRGDNARPTEGVDGKAFGAELAGLGFRTRILLDLDETRLSAAIEEFARGVPTRGAALVYFHGLSMPAENDDRRLLGIDVDLRSLEVGEKGCVVSRVLGLLEASGATRPTVLVGGFSLIGGSIEPVRSFFPNSGADLRKEYRARASTVISSPEKLLPGGIPGDEWVNARGMVFCWCPAGELPGSRGDTTPGFWIAKFELTLRESGLELSKALASHRNHPMDMIHPDGMRKFLNHLNVSETHAGRLPPGWEYALPTEPEWEYACRAGTSGQYYFGEDRKSLARHANFADTSLLGWSYTRDSLDDKTAELARVGKYGANPWGLHDMYGNLWEWVESPGAEWIARGGGWVSEATYCTSMSRRVFKKRRARNFLGYRIILRRKL